MLICYECGSIFREDEARIEQDKDYVNNGLGMECVRCDDILHCPDCDSDEVDEAVLCKECGEYFYREGYNLICPSCREEEDLTEDPEIYDEDMEKTENTLESKEVKETPKKEVKSGVLTTKQKNKCMSVISSLIKTIPSNLSLIEVKLFDKKTDDPEGNNYTIWNITVKVNSLNIKVHALVKAFFLFFMDNGRKIKKEYMEVSAWGTELMKNIVFEEDNYERSL